MSTCENVLLNKTNREKYSIAFLARFEEPLPVSHIIRVTAPLTATKLIMHVD